MIIKKLIEMLLGLSLWGHRSFLSMEMGKKMTLISIFFTVKLLVPFSITHLTYWLSHSHH